MMHKESDHPSSIEIFIGGIQILLVHTWIWGGGEITFHASILIPVVKVIALLDTL